MSDELEVKMRIYVNTDVTMSRGKYAAQAVHAALLAVGAHPGVPVIVLGATRTEVAAKAVTVADAGRTEIKPGTLTAGTDWRTDHDAEASQGPELVVNRLISFLNRWRPFGKNRLRTADLPPYNVPPESEKVMQAQREHLGSVHTTLPRVPTSTCHVCQEFHAWAATK